MSDWIDVNNRFPEVEEQVLVYGRASLQSARFVQPAMLKKRLAYGDKLITDELWWDGYDIIGYDGETDEIVEVTHWMPLPEPPKEEKWAKHLSRWPSSMWRKTTLNMKKLLAVIMASSLATKLVVR